MPMRLAALAAVFLALLGREAVAQQIAGTSYRFASSAPASSFAASPTDWLVLAAGNKTVSVTNITLCGLIQPPGTGSVALPFALIERSTADSAGTSSVVPAVNLSGTTVAAASAVRVYTANPTLGTTIGSIANPVINAGPSAAGCAVLDFGTRGASPIVLRGPQQLAINLGGVAVPSGGVLTYQIEVVER